MLFIEPSSRATECKHLVCCNVENLAVGAAVE